MGITAAIVGGGAALAGGIASATADQPTVDNQFLQNPEYPHSQDARDLWWNKLQDWGKDPNYGAISPDWNDIWDQTQKKVKQYYEGGPLAPGVQNRIDSSLASRGMSENPASDFLHAQVGAQESGDLGSLSAQQNIAKNQFAESGRNTWLGSIQNFQAQKPAGQWNTTINDPGATQRGIGQAVSGVGSSLAGFGLNQISNANNNSYLENLLKQNQNTPQSYSPGISWSNI